MNIIGYKTNNYTKFINFALLVCISIFFCVSCHKPRYRPHVPTAKLKYHIITEPDARCNENGCNRLRAAKYIKNLTDASVKVLVQVVQTRKIPGIIKHREVTNYYYLEKNEKIYIGCDFERPLPNEDISETGCVVSCSYSVKSIEFAHNEDLLDANLIFLAYNGSPAQLASSSVKNPNRNCDDECKKNRAFCFRLNQANKWNFNISSALRKFYNELQMNRTALNKDTVLNAFNATDNCGRSDISFEYGKFLNTGEGNCYAKTTISIMTIKEEITINMPKIVEGVFRKEGTKFVAAFNDPQKAAKIKFGSKLDKAFGGIIWEVALSKQNLILSTDRGCISISY